MALDCFNSYLEINMRIFNMNIHSLLASIPEGTQMIPVLKGNAYGFGAVKMAEALSEFKEIQTFAVAQVGEGLELRKAGIGRDILVLGAFPGFQLPLAVKGKLLLTVFDVPTVEALEAEAARQNCKVGVHIKIETGLNRIGDKPGEKLAELLQALAGASHLQVKGCFTHFVDGEHPDSPLAKRQFALYQKAVEQIRAAGFPIPLCHVCNSGASEWFREAFLDGVRIGRRMYMDSRDDPKQPGSPGAVEELASWRTSIVNIHEVSAGESVGYDAAFVAERPTKVATVCVGYGDGLFSGLVSAKSPCLVKNELAHYIGICMDQSFLDVTGIDCRVGDEVTIFGRSSGGAFLSAQELAKTVGHEGVFFTSALSNRVERRYIHKE